MSTIMKISSRNLSSMRRRSLVKGGMAGILAAGLAPTFARAETKKLVMAHLNAVPESAAVAFDWQAQEVRKRSNGKIGDQLDKQFQEKYKLKTLCFFDYGFRHFWTSKKAIIEPKDLRGAKIRVQQAKVFGDTINGLGGNAVPMAWGEVISAAKQGVIDGGDLPIVNMLALKIYEVSKYASMTFHNYGPTNAVMNLEIWNGLSPEHQKLIMDLSRAAQEKIREATESVDNFAKAKSELEPFGMTVVEAKVEEFRKVAQQKIWPAYKAQYGALWDEIEGFKA